MTKQSQMGFKTDILSFLVLKAMLALDITCIFISFQKIFKLAFCVDQSIS